MVALNILDKKCINAIKQLSAQDKYPQLFQPLNKMNDKYKIELDDNAAHFAFTSARKVPIPLLTYTTG